MGKVKRRRKEKPTITVGSASAQSSFGIRCCRNCAWLAYTKDGSLICMAATTSKTLEGPQGEEIPGLLVAIFKPDKPTECGSFEWKGH